MRAVLSLFCLLLLSSCLLGPQLSLAGADTWDGEGLSDLLPASPAGQAVALPNNFGDVETWDYPSGLRVHFKSMPEVSNIYITAVLPVGSSSDPRGLEGLAHFVEHMVFTDHRGRTEEEIKQAVLDRGGRKNATTSRYLTRYYVDLPASQWAFGINWMYELLTEHRFKADVTDQERKVVMLEKSRRQSDNWELLDQVQQWLRARNILVNKDFWEQEFGLAREHRSVFGTYRSLRQIDVSDLQTFYDQYYGPQNFSVVIVGNANRSAVKELVDRTFASWPRSGEWVNPEQFADDPGQFKQRIRFSNSKNVDHRIAYKLYSPSEHDLEMAYFTARFLRHLLNQRLRLEHKTTYGVSVNVDSYAGHALLSIAGNYDKDKMANVSELIDSSLEELKAGGLDEWQFESFRGRAVSDLYLGYQTATSIANWCNVFALCNKQIYQGFPDKISHWENLTQAEFSSWLEQNLLESRKVVDINKPSPVSIVVEVLGGLLVVLAVFYGLRRWWKQPVDMRDIRYVSKIRYPLSLMAAACFVVAAIAFMVLLLGFYAHSGLMNVTATVDSYVVQLLVRYSMMGVAAGALLTVPAIVPRKLLLFKSNWRVKFWSFRSAAYAYSDLREIRECSFFSLLFSRRVCTTVFLHWGFLRKGVYIRVGDRFGYFLRARDNGELVAQFQRCAVLTERRAGEQSAPVSGVIRYGRANTA